MFLALLFKTSPEVSFPPVLLFGVSEGAEFVDEEELDDGSGVSLVDDEEPGGVETDEFEPDDGGWTVPFVLELTRPGHAVSADPARESVLSFNC